MTNCVYCEQEIEGKAIFCHITFPKKKPKQNYLCSEKIGMDTKGITKLVSTSYDRGFKSGVGAAKLAISILDDCEIIK